MIKNLSKLMLLYIVLFLSDNLNAQSDVTKFLGLPVDGTKTELIEKLKAKGFTVNSYNKDVLMGEFNGSNINIFIKTNKNKVCRLMVSEVHSMNETNIKIKFNNLIQQFKNNNKYLTQPDSTLVKFTIPENEDITYEMTVNNKQYQAVFYQKTESYDSLEKQINILSEKEKMNDEEFNKYTDLSIKKFEETLDSYNKTVWFTISEINDKYTIMIFYDNMYNMAKGDEL